MSKELSVIIYVIGYVACYVMIKKAMKEKIWTVGDRNIALFCSLSSWVGVLASLALLLFNREIKKDKPAKW